MKQIYNLSQRFMARILAISFLIGSLCLQSCSNLAESLALRKGDTLEEIQKPTTTIDAKYLVDKEFVAEGGSLVTFHEQDGQLQADLRVDKRQENPNYRNLPVKIAPDIDLAQLPHLNKEGQKRFVHVHIPTNGQPGSVFIFRGGLQGGMMKDDEDDGKEEEIPDECFCPITQEIMEDPVIAQDGHTYERSAIQRWFDMGKRTSPKTGARLFSTELTPNHAMRGLIQDLKEKIPVLARHKLSMQNIEAAIKLREEEMRQQLELKGHLLQQEGQKIEDLERQLKELGLKQQKIEEVVVLLGNVGVGKSSIYNTVIQKAAFSPSVVEKEEKEIAINHQRYIHHKRLYIEIDTPGLSADQEKWEQAAKVIEKSLQLNNNYKIVFAVTLENEKIPPKDLILISTVCKTINVPFQYGLILNKVPQAIMGDIDKKGLETYLTPLVKKPAETVALVMQGKNGQQEEKGPFLNNESRNKLIAFFDKLRTACILQGDVKVDKVDLEYLLESVRSYKVQEVKIAKFEESLEMMRTPSFQNEVSEYFRTHKPGKNNIDWSKMTLTPQFYQKSILQQAQIVAAMYKDLLYPAAPKHGGWFLLARRCYQYNQFKGRILSPQEMDLRRIEPKYHRDPDYESNLIYHVRNGSLKLTSIQGKRINPFAASITGVNTSNKKIKFKIKKGQILEQDEFRDVQNLAVTGYIKTVKDDSTGKEIRIQNSFESIEDKEFEIEANSTLEFSVQCRCINPRSAVPNLEYMNETDFIDKSVEKEPDTDENPCSKYQNMPDLGEHLRVKK
jgi:GTP-binding protein EngB required for normal cell division